MVIIARFGFSKALLSTTQPPHQKLSGDNIAKNWRLPTITRAPNAMESCRGSC
jgi:hypothetical protein